MAERASVKSPVSVTRRRSRSGRRARRAGLVTALLALAALALLAPGLASAMQVKPGIVGGKLVSSITEFPFQVALYDPAASADPANSQFCGGVIIDATHVITAAHCVFDEAAGQASIPGDIEVLADTINLETEEQSSSEYVEDPVRATSFDPEWNPETSEHDIGVLTLQNQLPLEPLGEGGKIAAIPLASELPLEGAPLTVSGWGDTHPEPPEAARPSYPLTLSSVRLPFVSELKCDSDYGLEPQAGETFGPDFVCAGATEKDACYGDSGGPLFSGTPGSEEDRLIGTVDLGYGCGQEGFPGIYQSVIDSGNARFIKSEPPQAPLQQVAPSISGAARPGQALTCQPGSWTGAPQLYYAFYEDKSEFSNPSYFAKLTSSYSASPTYTVPSSMAAGTRIFCALFALNKGGYGEAVSKDVTVSMAAVTTVKSTPLPVVTPRPAPPALRVVSKSCKRTSCSVNVLASTGTGAAAVTTVEAKLSHEQHYSCRKHGKRATCTRTLTRKLTAKATPGGHFVIAATGLKPGAYTLTLSAIDKAGVRQTTPTKVALTVKRPAAKK